MYACITSILEAEPGGGRMIVKSRLAWAKERVPSLNFGG